MKEYQINSSKNKKTKTLDIDMQGLLNVSNISAIKKELYSVIKKNKTISLSISDVEDADLTMVQLIVSFRQKCQTENIDLKTTLDLSEETRDLFDRAGFVNIIN